MAPTKTFLTLAAACVLTVSTTASAIAGCTIYQNPNYNGAHRDIADNLYVKFAGTAPARQYYETTEDFWWHNRVSGVKMSGNCKAVFYGSHGSKETHFQILQSTPHMVSGQNDLTQGVTCECN